MIHRSKNQAQIQNDLCEKELANTEIKLKYRKALFFFSTNKISHFHYLIYIIGASFQMNFPALDFITNVIKGVN